MGISESSTVGHLARFWLILRVSLMTQNGTKMGLFKGLLNAKMQYCIRPGGRLQTSDLLGRSLVDKRPPAVPTVGISEISHLVHPAPDFGSLPEMGPKMGSKMTQSGTQIETQNGK